MKKCRRGHGNSGGDLGSHIGFRKTRGEVADVEAETRLGELKTDSLILSKHVYNRIKVAFK